MFNIWEKTETKRHWKPIWWLFLRDKFQHPSWIICYIMDEVCSVCHTISAIVQTIPDRKVHWANLGPTGPMNLAIWDCLHTICDVLVLGRVKAAFGFTPYRILHDDPCYLNWFSVDSFLSYTRLICYTIYIILTSRIYFSKTHVGVLFLCNQFVSAIIMLSPNNGFIGLHIFLKKPSSYDKNADKFPRQRRATLGLWEIVG